MYAMDAEPGGPTPRRIAVAGVVVLGVVVLVLVARRDPPSPPVTARPSAPAVAPSPTPPPPGPGGVPFAPEPPAALQAFADMFGPGRRMVPVAQGGLPLRIDAVSSTGALLGGAGFDADPYRAVDRVGLVEPGDTAVRWLTRGSMGPIYGRAAGDGVVAWAEARDSGVLQVMCARAGNRWRPVRISTTGVDITDRPLHADGGTVAWTDEAGTAWAADDCARPRSIGRGHVLALALPVAYLRVADGGVEIVRLVGPPRSTRVPVSAVPAVRFAASEGGLVWVANGGLVRYDRETSQVRTLDVTLPTGAGASGEIVDLTAGNRLVVYTSRPLEGDPSLTRAVVYDLVTGAWLPFAAEVFVADDVIVWREADHYAVTAVE
jgi:hypothetical protein